LGSALVSVFINLGMVKVEFANGLFLEVSEMNGDIFNQLQDEYCLPIVKIDDVPAVIWGMSQHFFPQSKDPDGSYKGVVVICCHLCNVIKGGAHPDDFIAKMTLADLKGKMLKHFTDKQVKKIAASVNKIYNDALYNRSVNCYYISRHPNKLPKNFIEIKSPST
jgi:hypothetical protein